MGSQADPGIWKEDCARNWAETSGLLGWGYRPWGGFLSWGAGGGSQGGGHGSWLAWPCAECGECLRLPRHVPQRKQVPDGGQKQAGCPAAPSHLLP